MGRKITGLTAQKKNRNRVNVHLDGEFAFGLSRIVAAWLYVGQELSEGKIAELLAEDGLEVAYQKAIHFLSFRERTTAEVIAHLRELGTADAVTSQTIDRLMRSGLIDDQRFTENWVQNRSEYRPRSRRALLFELKQKGVAEDTIQEALEDWDEEGTAYQAALKQARKLRGMEWPEFRRKLIAFLGRRGFNYESAGPAASRVWQELSAENELDEVHPENEEVEI